MASELHLGLESALARSGAFLRSRTDTLAQEILDDARTARANRLLLLGDVKHRYTHNTWQEKRDVPRFFETLSGAFEEIIITPGNHDTGLRALLSRARFPKVRITSASGIRMGSGTMTVGACHGHRWPSPGVMSAALVLLGHTHAACDFVDENGQRNIEWAWLRGRIDPARAATRYARPRASRVIVFPPYNPLCGGTPVNRDGLLGPVAKVLDPNGCSLWLLDGRRVLDLEGHDLVSRRSLGPESD